MLRVEGPALAGTAPISGYGHYYGSPTFRCPIIGQSPWRWWPKVGGSRRVVLSSSSTVLTRSPTGSLTNAADARWKTAGCTLNLTSAPNAAWCPVYRTSKPATLLSAPHGVRRSRSGVTADSRLTHGVDPGSANVLVASLLALAIVQALTGKSSESQGQGFQLLSCMMEPLRRKQSQPAKGGRGRRGKK